MSNHNNMPLFVRKLKQALRLLPSTVSFRKSLSCTQLAFSTRPNEQNDSDNGEVTFGENWNNQLITTDKSTDHDGATTNNLLPVIVVSPSFSLNLSQNDIHKLVLTGSTGKSSLLASEDTYLSSHAVKSINLTTDDILINPFGCPFNYDLNIYTSEKIPVDVFTTPAPLLPICNQSSRLVSLNDGKSISEKDIDSAVDTEALYNDLSNASASVKNENLLLFSSTESRMSEKQTSGPTPEQLLLAREKVILLVEEMLKGSTDQSILHKDVILENNLFGKNKICKGVTAYYLEILKLRIQVHARNSKATMDVLNVNTVEQTGVIRVHWRMTGVSQLQVLKFWRFLAGSEVVGKDDKEWFEAFSYFFIGKDGLVHKHRMDRTLPDDGVEPNLKEKLQSMLNPAKPLVS